EPTTGAHSATFAIDVAAKVVAHLPGELTVEFRDGDVTLQHLSLGADNGGGGSANGSAATEIQFAFSTLSVRPDFEVRIDGRIKGRGRFPLALVRGRREKLETDYEPQFSPLVL